MFWYQLFVILHLFSLILLAGGALGSIVSDYFFWKNLPLSISDARLVASISKPLALLAQIGSMSALVTGLILLALGNWLYVGQLWLQIKFILFVLLFLNGILIAKPAAAKTMMLVAEVASQKRNVNDEAFVKLKSRLSVFHKVQTLGLLILICLAVLKVNI